MADVVNGTGGNDVIDSTWPGRVPANDEIISGLGGDDNIFGLGGADTLNGNAGDDFLRGGLGNDILDGGAGNDIADYSDKTTAVVVTLNGANNATVTVGGVAEDTIRNIENVRGGSGNDTLVGDGDQNFLRGNLGADALDGGGGFDFVDYRASTQGLTVSLATPGLNTGEAVGDTFVSIEGIRGSDFNDTLIGNSDDNFLRGGLGADTLDGGGGTDFADYLNSAAGLTVSLANPGINTGEAAGDTFTSIEGLQGSEFADTLIGDDGNNRLRGRGGADALDGAAGTDYADYRRADSGVTASLGDSSINTGDAAGDTYTSIEGLIGSEFNDRLVGDSSDNNLRGGFGADILDGGGDFDFADYRGNFDGDSTGPVTASLANPTINTGSAAGDTYISIEGLIGSEFDDTLIGDANVNFLRGDLGADALDGGGGFDFADYRNSTVGLTVNLANAAGNTGEASGDTFVRIEGIRGSDFNDTLIGDANDNFLRGGLGSDVLNGGSAGTDFADYRNAVAGVTASLASPASNTSEAVGDSYISIEGLSGSSFGDTLIGNGGDNVLIGREGADVLNGGAGTDTARYNYGDEASGVTSGVTVSLANPATNTGDAAGDTFVSIENLVGTDLFADKLTGDGGVNVISGLGGNDILDGGANADTLNGGGGNDTFIVDNAGDKVFEGAGGGTDAVTTTVSYALTAAQEIETLQTNSTLGSAVINLTGNAFGQRIVGNAAANVINGGGGADTMYGFGGNDTFIVDNAGDQVVETTGNGTDTVSTTVSYALAAGQEIETLQTNSTIGTAVINLTGNALAQKIVGNAAVNIINGGAGADQLYGFAGNDTYIVDNAGDKVFETAGNGSDTVSTTVSYALTAGQEIETLQTNSTAGATAINLTGNELAQKIVGNAAANAINGGTGADQLYGLNGNDSYIVDNVGDKVFEASGGGNDTVYASVSYSLAVGQQVETLSTMGSSTTAAISLVGNEFANKVVGNAAANTLNGAAGNDTLYGFGGSDTFRFNTALNASTNVDHIMDYNVAADTIQLENGIFTALTSTGTLASNAFFIGTAAHDTDDRIIYNTSTGALIYDSNGSAAGGAVQFATISPNLALTNADFVVI